MTFSATYFGSSGWLLEFENIHIFVDPWLKGPLTFSPGAWLFEGNLVKSIPMPEEIDLLLLTQGLPDHCHPETLEGLDHSIPVIGPKSAINVVKHIGFHHLTRIEPGQSIDFNGLTIQATQGAPVPNFENGYILRHKMGSLYLEPHGFLDKNITETQLDALITPIMNVSLPIAGNFIKGRSVLPKLVEKFTPLTILSSTTGGSAIFSGLISKLINSSGSINDFNKGVIKTSRLIESIEGNRYELESRNK